MILQTVGLAAAFGLLYGSALVWAIAWMRSKVHHERMTGFFGMGALMTYAPLPTYGIYLMATQFC